MSQVEFFVAFERSECSVPKETTFSLPRLETENFESSPNQALQPKLKVKLATPFDLSSIYQLRYEVFFDELKATGSTSQTLRMDQDAFDEISDHLMVTDSTQTKIVGTYRMMPWARLLERGLESYCAQEFDLDSLNLPKDAKVLELGRSCVHSDYRNGTVPMLLWGGLARYIEQHSYTCLLGCVSVYGLDCTQAKEMANSLKSSGKWAEDGIDCKPRFPQKQKLTRRGGEASSGISIPHGTMTEGGTAPSLPSLFKAYLNLGAKVCGGPVYDPEFGCHDFLVFLDMKFMNQRTLSMLKRMAPDLT